MTRQSLFVITLLAFTLLTATRAEAITPAEAVESVRQCHASDKRTSVFENVQAVLDNTGTTVNLSGTVSSRFLRNALCNALRQWTVDDSGLNVLEDNQSDGHRWALVKLSVASLRCQPKHAAEMATQAVMGTPLRVLEKNGDWWRVQTPDAYISYVPATSIHFLTDNAFDTWRRTEGRRVIVTAQTSHLLTAPDSDEPVSDLVLGCILERMGQNGQWLLLATPDGRCGYAPAGDVQDLDTWVRQPLDMDKVLRTARAMTGAGYLWGGTSTKVTDCSGLSKICYLACGVILQRDASQQALTGRKIANWADCQPGDLLFFGNEKTGRVTHVGLYLHDGQYIHCSGQVKVNSLTPGNSNYLYSPLNISRIAGEVGTRGISSVGQHPWFYVLSSQSPAAL